MDAAFDQKAARAPNQSFRRRLRSSALKIQSTIGPMSKASPAAQQS
jgi:hypothetical protein